MAKIKAQKTTWITVSPVPAAALPKEDKIEFKEGATLAAESADILPDGYARVRMTLAGRMEWYAYVPHWDGLPLVSGTKSPVGWIEPKDIRLNSIAKQMIRAAEGLSLKAYLDPLGIPTIGIGTTLGWDDQPIQLGMSITESEAWQFFERDCDRFVQGLRSSIKVKVTGKQAAAVLDFAYNVGVNAFAESTLLKCINSHKSVQEIQFQFNRWNADKLEGLRRRRLAEGWLWEGKDFSEEWFS
jgi:lysozyme